MSKIVISKFLIVPTLILITCSCRDMTVIRKLEETEAKSILKRFTGKEMPENVSDVRGMFYSDRGAQSIFLAFKTDKMGCSKVVDTFGGQDIKSEEFPRGESNPWLWSTSVFQKACLLQQELDIVLFDKKLLDRIKNDDLEKANTGHYPEDAVTGCYLESDAKSRGFYRILVFKDLGVIYVSAENPQN